MSWLVVHGLLTKVLKEIFKKKVGLVPTFFMPNKSKNIIFIFIVAVLLVACRKDYRCRYNDGTEETFLNINTEQANLFRDNCENLGGIWMID